MVGGRGVLEKAWSTRLKCPPCSLRFKRRNGLWQPRWLQTGLTRRISGEPALLLLSLLRMSLRLLGPAASPGDCRELPSWFHFSWPALAAGPWIRPGVQSRVQP